MYQIQRTTREPGLNGDVDDAVWATAQPLELTCFHPRSSAHRPRTSVRVLHDNTSIYLHFSVADRFVRAVRTEYQDSVCRDSCVEFFVQPKPESGYFNFEINCGGTLLLSYVTDCERIPEGGFREWEPVSWEHAREVEIHTSLPRRVWPEIQEPVDWWVKYRIPVGLFEHYVGPIGELSGQEWRANFYKCGDETSFPHWASWQPVGEKLNFHKPESFGPIVFA